MFNSSLSGIKKFITLAIDNSITLPDVLTASEITGNIRYNKSLLKYQFYDGTNWQTFDTSTGTNLWEVSGSNLKPISPYTSILANTISSFGTGDDIDLIFKTKGTGKFQFEVDPTVFPGKIEFFAPNITTGNEIDFYLGKSTSNMALFGYGYNTDSNSTYAYFGNISGSNDKRMRIYGSGTTLFPRDIWLPTKDNNGVFAFFGTKAVSPAGSGISIENNFLPEISSKSYENNYDILQINCNQNAANGGIVRISNPTSRVFVQAPLNLSDYTAFINLIEGDVGYDKTNHEIVFYNGTAWKSITGYTLNNIDKTPVINAVKPNNKHGVENNAYTYISKKFLDYHGVYTKKLESRIEELEKKIKLISDKLEISAVKKKLEEISEADMGNSLNFT